MATRSLGSLTLDLIARIGGFTSGLSKAEREAQRRVRGIEGTFRGLGRTVAGVAAAIAGAGLIGAIVRNTVQAQNGLAQLDAALKSTGQAAGFSRDQLVGMANDFAKASTNSSSEIIDAQTRLLTYSSIVGEQFPAALQAAIDQSARLGISLTQSAEIIGRALETPSRGVASLTRQGFNFTQEQRKLLKSLEDTGRMAEAQAIVLDVLNESYGGAAQAARDTLGGALAAVRNGFKDLLTGKDGLPEATRALNEFASTLKDPGFKQAADSVFGAIGDYVTHVTKGVIGWGVIFGLVGDDFFKLDKEIEKVQNRLNAMQDRQSGGLPNWWDWLIQGDSPEKIAEVRKELDGLLAKQREMIEAMGDRSQVSGSPSVAVPFVAPPSEEFLKLEARLKEQIALYGRVGEAAKIAYRIQSGQLDELSESEQQRVLRLARQYDALVANAAAEKELEQARKQLQSSYESQVSTLERQIALTGEVTELERIRFDISRGSLQGIDAEQTRYLESLARQIDANKDLNKEVERLNEAMERGKSLTESLRTPLELYQDTLADVNDLLMDGAISYETYTRAVERAQKELDAATNQWTVFKDQAARNTQDIIADTLTNGFEDGTKGIIKAFGDMIVQLTAQAVAADLARKLFGDPQNSSSGGGWVGSALGLLGGFFGGGRAAGGPVSAGGMYRVNELEGEYFIPNSSGTVVPLSKMNAGSQNVTNNFNITTPNGQMSMQTRQQIMADVARGMASANRRNN